MKRKNTATYDDYLSSDDGMRNELLALADAKWEKRDMKIQECGMRGYFNLNKDFPPYSLEGDEGDYEEWSNGIIDGLMEKFGIPKGDYCHSRHAINVNTPGAWVREHIDPIQILSDRSFIFKGSCFEARFNTFLRRADSGGTLYFQGGEKVSLPEGMASVIDSQVPHWTDKVGGDTVRVNLTLGAVVLSKHRDKLFNS